MYVIIHTILFLCVGFNFIMMYLEGKKLYTFYKERHKRKCELKNKISEQKIRLNKSLGNLKLIKLKRPLRAEFTLDEAINFNELMDKLKQDNTHLYVFINTLLEFVGKEDIRVFFNRVKDLSIDYVSLEEMKRQAGSFSVGVYNSKNNIIKMCFNKNNCVLDHELLHAASTEEQYSNVGFSVVFLKAGIFGEGLNEGYTELLNNRIFKHTNSSYMYLTYLVELIENFYENKEDMMKDYFHADVFALIGELLKSMSLEEALDIITSMDLLLHQDDASFIDFVILRQKIMRIYERKILLEDSKGGKKLVK